MNKKILFNLKHDNEPGGNQHEGSYFEIKNFLNKYYLYYASHGKIKLIISSDLSFHNKPILNVIENAPSYVFTIIKDNGLLYMLCGSHISNKEENEINIPDLVWPKKKRTLLDWRINRKDRRNGMYLLKSNNGIDWEEKNNIPVLHSYISSDSCKLGECCFDTHPCLIKWKNEYIFFGRLNSSLDERRIYTRKSKDLINWSLPEKITISNENKNNLKKNYYNFVVFEKDGYLYAFTPYFEACGTEARNCCNGKTLLLKSKDALNWEIIDSYFPHLGKYKDRVNSVLIENDNIKVFFRENCLNINQNLTTYNYNLQKRLFL